MTNHLQEREGYKKQLAMQAQHGVYVPHCEQSIQPMVWQEQGHSDTTKANQDHGLHSGICILLFLFKEIMQNSTQPCSRHTGGFAIFHF